MYSYYTFIAASVMYEQAMRLSQEPHSAPIIAKQAQCLLACINALHHVSEKYRWIVRPVDQNLSGELNSSAQKKRNIDGKEILHYKIKKQVEVLELDDIRKEYFIVDARLKISKVNSEMHIVAHTGKHLLIAIYFFMKCKLSKLILKISLYVHRAIRADHHFVQYRFVHNGITFVRRI